MEIKFHIYLIRYMLKELTVKLIYYILNLVVNNTFF